MLMNNCPRDRQYFDDGLTLYILRGLPGSGKSYLAAKLQSTFGGSKASVVSADTFRYNDLGDYKWTAEDQDEARRLGFEQVGELCQRQCPVVIIDNTNRRRCDVDRYFSLAAKFNYIIALLEPTTPWKMDVTILSQKNSHGVSLEKLQEMRTEYEDIIPYFYGWFFSLKISRKLTAKCNTLYQEFINIPEFRNYICSQETDCELSSLHSLYCKSGRSTNKEMHHVTSFFSNSGIADNAQAYASNPLTLDAMGKATWIHVSALCFTKRTVFARVRLTDSQLRLYCGAPDGHAALAHITLGHTEEVEPVQCLIDNRFIADKEATSKGCLFHLRTDHGLLEQVAPSHWVITFNDNDIYNLPAFFTGFYK